MKKTKQRRKVLPLFETHARMALDDNRRHEDPPHTATPRISDEGSESDCSEVSSDNARDGERDHAQSASPISIFRGRDSDAPVQDDIDAMFFAFEQEGGVDVDALGDGLSSSLPDAAVFLADILRELSLGEFSGDAMTLLKEMEEQEAADDLKDVLADDLGNDLSDNLGNDLTDNLADNPADALTDDLADVLTDYLPDVLADSRKYLSADSVKSPSRRDAEMLRQLVTDGFDDASFDVLSAELAHSMRRKPQQFPDSDASLALLQLKMGHESGAQDSSHDCMADPMFSGWGLRNASDLSGLGALPPENDSADGRSDGHFDDRPNVSHDARHDARHDDCHDDRPNHRPNDWPNVQYDNASYAEVDTAPESSQTSCSDTTGADSEYEPETASDAASGAGSGAGSDADDASAPSDCGCSGHDRSDYDYSGPAANADGHLNPEALGTDSGVWQHEKGNTARYIPSANGRANAAPFPTLNKIGKRLAGALGRRLHTLTSREWTVVPISSRSLTLGEALQGVSGLGMSVEIEPLAGESLVVADDRLCRLLGLAMLDGAQHTMLEDSPDMDVLRSATVRELVSYVLQIFLLDFEWAMAPYFEVESNRKHILTVRNGVARSYNRLGKRNKAHGNKKLFRPERSGGLPCYSMAAPETPCIVMRCFVLSGAEGDDSNHSFGVPITGSLQFVFPLDVVEPLLEMFRLDGVLLAPDDTETDDDLYLRLRLIPDERLVDLISRSHPMMGAVLLQRFGEQRRQHILNLLEPDSREELVRRMGRRAKMTQVLSAGQRFVVRTLALGEVHAAGFLSTCSDTSAADFLSVAATLPPMFPDQVTAVLSETNPHVVTGASLFVDEAYVRRLLMRGIVPERMERVVSLMDYSYPEPLSGVFSIASDVLVARLRREPAEVTALVLRTLMGQQDPSKRGGAPWRDGRLYPQSDNVSVSVAQQKSGRSERPMAEQGGPQKAGRVFALLPPTLRPAVIERIIRPREHDLRIIRLIEAAIMPSDYGSGAFRCFEPRQRINTHEPQGDSIYSRTSGHVSGGSQDYSQADCKPDPIVLSSHQNDVDWEPSVGADEMYGSIYDLSADGNGATNPVDVEHPADSGYSPLVEASYLLECIDDTQRYTLLRILEETGVPETEALRECLFSKSE